MKPSSTAKSLTVRLSPEVYESSLRVAKQRCISLNSLVQESLKKQIAADEDRQWSSWFDELGSDTIESDVEFAACGQAEVVLIDAS